MSNPYRTPEESEATQVKVNPLTIVDRFAWFLPIVVVVSIYMTWLIAWLVVGRMPTGVKAVDIDSVFFKIAFRLSDFGCNFFAPITLGLNLMQLTARRKPLKTKLKRAGMTVLLVVAVLAAFFIDPTGAFVWMIEAGESGP